MVAAMCNSLLRLDLTILLKILTKINLIRNITWSRSTHVYHDPPPALLVTVRNTRSTSRNRLINIASLSRIPGLRKSVTILDTSSYLSRIVSLSLYLYCLSKHCCNKQFISSLPLAPILVISRINPNCDRRFPSIQLCVLHLLNSSLYYHRLLVVWVLHYSLRFQQFQSHHRLGLIIVSDGRWSPDSHSTLPRADPAHSRTGRVSPRVNKSGMLTVLQ